MILWGMIVGALLGWCLALLGSIGGAIGAVVGGLVGLAAGKILQASVRGEIDRATRDLRSELQALRRERDDLYRAEVPIHQKPLGTAPAAQPRVVFAEPRPTETAYIASKPPEPNLLEQAFAGARAWLFGGNTIVRVGLVILFVGLSFLARYAASAGLFPVELRLALVIAAGIVLLAVGFLTRERRPGFAVALQGTGVATIYLTLFAAARMFELIPIVPVFALMIVVCALGCALALLQNAQGLAVASFAGGFAVPLLLSDGSGNVLVAFGYYTILNLTILAIARQRSWRFVNLIGVAATFGTTGAWGALAYTPALYMPAQAFLIVSVLIYVATAILHAHNTPGRFGNVVDGSVLFGPALAGFGLQVGLVKHLPFGSALAALGFAALYLLLAAATLRRRQQGLRVLNESLFAIGVGFATLAVPLALGARWTSASWAIEGAAAFWLGSRQARWLPRAFALVLQLVAMLVFLANLHRTPATMPWLDPDFLGALLIALPALATAWWMRNDLPHDGSRWALAYARAERRAGGPTFLLGLGSWCLAWTLETTHIAPPALQALLAMFAFVASAALFAILARRRDWPVALWPSRLTLVALVLGFCASVGEGFHLLLTPNWAVWIAAIGLHLWLLRANDRDGADHPRLYRAVHVAGAWLASAMLADCLWLAIDAGDLWDGSWASVIFLVGATAILALLTMWAGRARPRRWPLDAYADAYYWSAALPIAGLVFAGALLTALFASGDSALPYVPLLNPIDISLALALGALLLWRQMVIAVVPANSGWVRGNRFLIALALLAFVTVNTLWLRLAHHVLGVAWGTDALLDSFVVQTGLAILWTLLALVLMVVAARRVDRHLWLAGAALLGMVVVKLLLVDLSNAGGGERIVTFIVVGVLMLVVGYLAPLPPRPETAEPVPSNAIPG